MLYVKTIIAKAHVDSLLKYVIVKKLVLAAQHYLHNRFFFEDKKQVFFRGVSCLRLNGYFKSLVSFIVIIVQFKT